VQIRKSRENIMFLLRVKKKEHSCKKTKIYLSYFAGITSLKKTLLVENKLPKKQIKKQTKCCLLKKKKYGESIVLQTFLIKLYLNKFHKDKKNNIVYVQHFLNLFLQGGKGYFAESLYKNFLIIHKHNKTHFLLNLFKIIRFLQFFFIT